jgi:hypothetical protein
MKLGSTPRQFTLSLEGPVASPPPLFCSHSQKRILSPFFATRLPRVEARDTHSASRKSFPCHSLALSAEGYENTPDGGGGFSAFDVQLSTVNRVSSLESALPTTAPATPAESTLTKRDESVSKQTTLTLVESALTTFCTSHSKQRTLSLIESTLPRFVTVTLLESALTKKAGEGGQPGAFCLLGHLRKREIKMAPLLAPRNEGKGRYMSGGGEGQKPDGEMNSPLQRFCCNVLLPTSNPPPGGAIDANG